MAETLGTQPIEMKNFFFVITLTGQLVLCDTLWLSLLNITPDKIDQYCIIDLLDPASRQWFQSLDLKNYSGETPYQKDNTTINVSTKITLTGLFKVATLLNSKDQLMILCHFVQA